MNTEIKNAVSATDLEAQYDEKVKRLLGNRSILAHILVRTVDAFRGMDPKEVENYIDGPPLIGIVPVEPGLTNAEKTEKKEKAEKAEEAEKTEKKETTEEAEKGQRVVGFNTENLEVNEGLARFDIVFYVRVPSAGDGPQGRWHIIINLEAQKDEPSTYHILNRAVFYVSRLVSSQKERDFVKQNYNDIHRVFSIFICMNMKESCMDYIHLTDEQLLGSHHWKGNLDLLNIVLIGISGKLPEHNEEYELHRLLGALLSTELSMEEKFDIIETEYGIPMEEEFREEVRIMCNLSQGVLERGIEQGIERGIEQGIELGRARGKEQLRGLKRCLEQEGRLDEFFDALEDDCILLRLYAEFGID